MAGALHILHTWLDIAPEDFYAVDVANSANDLLRYCGSHYSHTPRSPRAAVERTSEGSGAQALTRAVLAALVSVQARPVVQPPSPTKPLKSIAFLAPAALAAAMNDITADAFGFVRASDLVAVMSGAGADRPCFNPIRKSSAACGVDVCMISS